jgi:hypothetical protein
MCKDALENSGNSMGGNVKLFRIVCFFTVLLAASALQAQGIVMVEQETRNGKVTTNQIQLDKTHMRSESHATAESTAFVFDEKGQTARVLNLDKKTYMELDKGMMQQMQQQMAQMQEQMKNLPPQQRAMMEQMMRGRGGIPGMPGGAPPVKIEYKQTGSDKVGQWSCTKYEGSRGQEKVTEVCTVDPKELGVTPADFEVAKHLAEFLTSFMPGAADQIVTAGNAAEQGFSGIPVRRTSYSGGKVQSVSEIKEVRHEAIPASAFEVPAGFRKENPGGR